MLESVYQGRLIKKLERNFSGILILKNDTSYIQGMLDLSLFYRDRWAMLEVKAYEDAPQQPNQEYYVAMLDDMSYAAFIFPENEKEVMDDLHRLFEA